MILNLKKMWGSWWEGKVIVSTIATITLPIMSIKVRAARGIIHPFLLLHDPLRVGEGCPRMIFKVTHA